MHATCAKAYLQVSSVLCVLSSCCSSKGGMSGIPTVNVVEDEEMSSQGSVNAPVAPQGTATQEQVSAQRPTEQVGIPVEWKPWKPVTTQLSGVAGPTRTHSQTVPVRIYAGSCGADSIGGPAIPCRNEAGV